MTMKSGMTDGEWLAGLFAAIDAMDTKAFVGYLAESGEFRFGNLPPVAGHAAIAQFVSGFFASIKSLKHEVEAFWRSGDHLICRGTVTYVRHDAREVRVPFANILRIENGVAGDYRIYADASALFA